MKPFSIAVLVFSINGVVLASNAEVGSYQLEEQNNTSVEHASINTDQQTQENAENHSELQTDLMATPENSDSEANEYSDGNAIEYSEVLTDESSLVSETEATLPRESYFDNLDSLEQWDDTNDQDLYAYDTEISEQSLPEGLILPALPGDDVNYRLKVYRSNYHDLHGRADSDIGKLRFKAKLMPNSEVKIEFNIKGEEDALFQAYIDLANYVMELDGGGAILTTEQKQMMDYTAEHLRQSLIKKFLDEIPVHSVMTMQMLAYWSKSPNGYAHNKREIVEN